MNNKVGFLTCLFLFVICSVVNSQDILKDRWKLPEYDRQKYQWITNSENINYSGDQTIDVNYYKIDLTVTTSPNYISGSIKVIARVDTASINSLFLDLAQNMAVDSILIEDAVLAQFNHLDDKINISLDRSYLINEVICLTVYYQGLPNVHYGFIGLKFDEHNGQPVIWSTSEPYFAYSWWPCKDTPSDKADSAEIVLTVDTSMIPVSNGSLKNIVINNDGTHTYFWKVSYPIAEYLLSVAISNYQLYTNYYVYSSIDSMAITNYLYPESYTPQNLSYLDNIPEMLGVYSSLFGEYPFINEKFGHAECYTAMEHQTITSIVAFDEELIPHETAHQWFGDKITCKDWHHIWLNEGFASYVSAIWQQIRYGQTAYNQAIQNLMSFAKTLNNSVWVEDITNVENIFRPETYIKGELVLHMLRGVMGDSLFFKTLFDYINDPELAYNVATTEDFQRVSEKVFEEDLDYFFSQWIYGKKYPKYKIYWGTELVDSTWNLGIKIEQTVNTSPPFFTMPVEIKVNYASGDTIIKLFNDSQIQEYTLNIPYEPVSIAFDPNNWILKDVLSIVLGIEDENVPVEFSLAQNYPNPFNPSTKIKYSIPFVETHRDASLLVTLKVYDVLGNEIETLVNEEKPAGNYEITWNAVNLPSGVYFYQLKAGDFIKTKKMILLK
jgi:aminopeptidase N